MLLEVLILQTSKSFFAYCVFLGSFLIAWKIKKQTVVSRSSAEAKLRALACGTAEVTWLRWLLADFDVVLSSSTLHIVTPWTLRKWELRVLACPFKDCSCCDNWQLLINHFDFPMLLFSFRYMVQMMKELYCLLQFVALVRYYMLTGLEKRPRQDAS
jgi:hypothetical protein